MPDWVASRLTVLGKNSKEIIKSLLTEKRGVAEVDFNKIVQMPEELNVECSSFTDNCMWLFVAKQRLAGVDNCMKNRETKTNEYVAAYREYGKKHCCLYLSNTLTTKEFQSRMNDTMEMTDVAGIDGEPHVTCEEDVFSYGKKALDNIIKYGVRDWYDWRMDHWGAKWNAYRTRIDGDSVIFLTAWYDVRGLISALSKNIPDNNFIYEYAHEELGYFTGRYEYKRGATLSSVLYGDYSEEAYDLAFELFGVDKSEYHYNEETQRYEYIED